MRQLTPRFNRTFMELKSLSCEHPYKTRKFQSYLYGIEIRCIEVIGPFRLVSIVPLWN